jgi:hypothetical protein
MPVGTTPALVTPSSLFTVDILTYHRAFRPIEGRSDIGTKDALPCNVAALAGTPRAAVPPEIAKQLVEIGRICVPEAAQIYRPLHPNPPYSDVSIARDISFGPDPKNVLDVFSPEKGGGSLPVLIYVSGGAGNKPQGGPNGDVFYDNIILWAVKNGMVGVNMQRRPGETWDDWPRHHPSSLVAPSR